MARTIKFKDSAGDKNNRRPVNYVKAHFKELTQLYISLIPVTGKNNGKIRNSTGDNYLKGKLSKERLSAPVQLLTILLLLKTHIRERTVNEEISRLEERRIA